jgi:hypothetical protein
VGPIRGDLAEELYDSSSIDMVFLLTTYEYNTTSTCNQTPTLGSRPLSTRALSLLRQPSLWHLPIARRMDGGKKCGAVLGTFLRKKSAGSRSQHVSEILGPGTKTYEAHVFLQVTPTSFERCVVRHLTQSLCRTTEELAQVCWRGPAVSQWGEGKSYGWLRAAS